MLRVEKRDYSSNPWRLLDDNGEIWEIVDFDHPMGDGMPQKIPAPICADTKTEMVAKVLSMLEQCRETIKRQRDEIKRLKEG